MAYDKRPGMQNVVYLADSGRGRPRRGRSSHALACRRMAASGRWCSIHTIRRQVTSLDDPRSTATRSRSRIPTAIHQPDNLESTVNGLLVTEDPGSEPAVQPRRGECNDRPADATYRFSTGEITVAAPRRPIRRRGPDRRGRRAAPGRLGAWESTGVVDVSSVFGADTFLINVQAHTLWIEKAPGRDDVAPPGPDYTFKREGGQLLLIRIPGA